MSNDAVYQEHALKALASRIKADPYVLTRHHIDSYDNLLEHGAFDMLQNLDRILVKAETDDSTPVDIEVFFGRRTGKLAVAPVDIDASEARLRDVTYDVTLSTDVEIDMTIGQKPTHTFKFDQQVEIGKVPLMLHSRFCKLHGLSETELRERGECAYDRGGYFVVDGREKVIIGREDPVVNRLYVRTDNSPISPASHLAFIRAKAPNSTFPRTTTFYVKRGLAPTISVVVTHLSNVRSASAGTSAAADAAATSAAEDPYADDSSSSSSSSSSIGVPIFVLFRALGIESDRAILDYISDESDVRDYLRPSIVDAGAVAYSQRAAIEYLERLVPKDNTLKNILTHDFLPSAGVDFESKAVFLGRLVHQLVASVLGKREMLARDDYANKRITVSGALLGELMRDIFVRLRDIIMRRLNAEWASGTWRAAGDPTKLVTARNFKSLLETRLITDRIRRSLKGDWNADETDEKHPSGETGSLVQDLSRISYFSYLAHIRRVSNPIPAGVKIAEPHRLRASHWGAVCPVDTPDGPNIGIICHLATTATLTLADTESRDKAKGIILAYPGNLSVLEIRGAAAAAAAETTRVLVNDIWVAVTRDPKGLREKLREARRTGTIGRYTSISWDIFEREIAVLTDSGRVVRPLARLNKKVPGDDASVPLASPIALVKSVAAEWSDVIESGAVEMIDIEEIRSSVVIAMKPSEVAAFGQTRRYTHCELHPAASILSVPASTVPFMEHDAAPRNTLAMAQLKQAIGVYTTSYPTRMDTVGYVLHHPQLPLVTTRFAQDLWGGNHCHGENVYVAVSTYLGYNIDDAVIINEASIARGRLRISVYDTFRYEETFDMDADSMVVFGDLPEHETRIVPGDVLLNRKRITAASAAAPSVNASAKAKAKGKGGDDDEGGTKDMPVRATRKTSGTVDRVYIYPSPNNASARAVKLRMRHSRSPDLGDKLATRYSQKGVVGLILREEDMPFVSSSGIVPDIIFNPHSIPTRNTPAHILELLLGKAAAISGTSQYDCTTFSTSMGVGVDVVSEAKAVLEAHGLSPSGDEMMTSGFTGEQMECSVFTGINYYGRLKHMVEDKWQQRVAQGPVNAITRQPTKTADGGSGGLRVGEMERDALYAHGMACFAKESFMERSDGKRGPMSLMQTGVEGEQEGVRVDGGPPASATVRVPHTFKLLQQELQAMGLGVLVEAAGPVTGGKEGDGSDSDEEDPGGADALDDIDDDDLAEERGEADFGDGDGSAYANEDIV